MSEKYVWTVDKPRVLNLKTATNKEVENAVYVGRGSRWGNSHRIGPGCTRDQAVERFESGLTPADRAMIREELSGCDLICYCEPLNCHARVLLRIANSIAQ